MDAKKAKDTTTTAKSKRGLVPRPENAMQVRRNWLLSEDGKSGINWDSVSSFDITKNEVVAGGKVLPLEQFSVKTSSQDALAKATA